MRWSWPHQSPLSTLHPTHPPCQSLISTPFYKGGQWTNILVHLVVVVSFVKKLNSLAVHGQVFMQHGHVFNTKAATIHLLSHLQVVLTCTSVGPTYSTCEISSPLFLSQGRSKNAKISYKKQSRKFISCIKQKSGEFFSFSC